MRYVFWLVLLLPLTAGAVSKDLAGDAESRFALAHDAYRAGERVRLARIADSLGGHPLAPWLEYWQLRLRLEEDSTAGVAEFLERESSSYLAEKLRAEWLKYLGKHRDWERFQREYPSLVFPDQEVACYELQARLEQQRDVTALDEARPLWFSVVELPESCVPPMERLIADHRLNVDDIWARIRRLAEAKKVGAAKNLLRYLPTGSAPQPRTIDAAIDNPARYLARLPSNFSAKQNSRELALLAIQRMARNDPAPAATMWRGIEKRFSDADRAYVWAQIGWQAALRHMPEALDWYGLAGGASLTDEQRAWKVRAALRVQDWRKVAQAIGEMPRELAAQSDWSYWLGRALASQGQRAEAEVLFQKIGGQPNFYSNLADEELGRQLDVPTKAIPPTAEELAQVAAMPGLQRAMAVLHTDLRIEGVREWVWNLRGLNDRQLLAAAELARHSDIFDRAINTADRTLVQHDYSLRYLAPYREQVEIKTRELNLDSGWVYGLMRQESRFVIDARSSVGAKGLMQLMPATARWVARRIGLDGFRPHRVTEMDINVTLGTSYLKMVLDSLDSHPVLASAAYNAGPGRARRWQADRPLEGAIYAETIPFNETRDYVKKVMSHSVYYGALFEGRPQSLKRRLGIVSARGAGDATAAELP